MQDELRQLAKELQESKAGQAPGQARLQQMYGELEVARRQLAEGKLRTNKLNEAIQQVRKVWGPQKVISARCASTCSGCWFWFDQNSVRCDMLACWACGSA
jgi:hypothetical protein